MLHIPVIVSRIHTSVRWPRTSVLSFSEDGRRGKVSGSEASDCCGYDFLVHSKAILLALFSEQGSATIRVAILDRHDTRSSDATGLIILQPIL